MDNRRLKPSPLWSSTIATLVCVIAFAMWPTSSSSQLRLGPPLPPPAPGRAGAPIDLTGVWVSVVTEDWPYRMLTPPRGDYISVPLSAAGIAVADSWDLERDNTTGAQCKAFGAAAIMRVPTRLRINWEDEYTLKIEADAGRQTCHIHFQEGNSRPLISQLLEHGLDEPTWQGYSVAEWDNLRLRAGTQILGWKQPPIPSGGHLKIITARMKSGYLRSNGVPYSDDAVLTEYFNRFATPDGHEWFVVTSVVDDPLYLNEPYVTTSHFKKEPDDSKWMPTDCQTPPPPEGAVAPTAG